MGQRASGQLCCSAAADGSEIQSVESEKLFTSVEAGEPRERHVDDSPRTKSMDRPKCMEDLDPYGSNEEHWCGWWKSKRASFEIQRVEGRTGEFSIDGRIFVVHGDALDVSGTLTTDGEGLQGSVRNKGGGKSGYVRVRKWENHNEICTSFRESGEEVWSLDALVMRATCYERFRKQSQEIVCISRHDFAQLCQKLRGGQLDGEGAAAAFEAIAEDLSEWRALPVRGQSVEALPGVRFAMSGTEYFKAGDVGRVEKDPYLNGVGRKVFDVTWMRTGLTCRIQPDWTDLVMIVGSIPLFRDEVEALPGTHFTSKMSGSEVFAAGDRGRVSSRTYKRDGEQKFDVTWYRTGLSSSEDVQSWMKSLNVVGHARSPDLGDEVELLPGHSLEGVTSDKAVVVGKVTKTEDVPGEDRQFYHVTWLGSGKTTKHSSEDWPSALRLIADEEKAALIGPREKEQMETALNDSQVAHGKPVTLISGQPKEAARGLYHMMRVKNPFTEDSAAHIEQEVHSFVSSLKESAVLLELLEAKQEKVDEVNRIRRFYGEEAISRARNDLAYFSKVSRAPQGATPLQVAEVVEAELSGNLRYILNEQASELYVQGPNAIRDRGRGPVPLQHFMDHVNVKLAELAVPHVVALRFYTTTAFKYLNSPLRSREEYYDKDRPHPMPVTMAYIAEGIKKMRTAHAIQVEEGAASPHLTLWRGLKNMKISEEFLNDRAGGTEWAPMSTTSNLQVAAKYASSEDSILLKISLDNVMQYGADLQWLSAFPGESEVLYPPLTYLQPTQRDPEVVRLTSGQRFTVYEVTPTIP